MSNEPTNDPGFILIDTPEKKQQYAPKVPTDEVFEDGEWFQVGAFCSGIFHDGGIYRRKLPQAADDQQYRKAFEKWKKLGLSSEAHWLPRTKDSKCEPGFFAAQSISKVINWIEHETLEELGSNWDLYLPFPLPPLPRKETADEAFEKARNEWNTQEHLSVNQERLFNAAIAWKEREK